MSALDCGYEIVNRTLKPECLTGEHTAGILCERCESMKWRQLVPYVCITNINIHTVFCTTVYPASALKFSDPQDLTGQVTRRDDSYYGPISVTVGTGFPFAGQSFQTIYVRSYIYNFFTNRIMM